MSRIVVVGNIVGVVSLLWGMFGPRTYDIVGSGGYWVLGVYLYFISLFLLLVTHYLISKSNILDADFWHKSLNLSLILGTVGVLYGLLAILAYANMPKTPEDFVPYGIYIFFVSLIFILFLYNIGKSVFGKFAKVLYSVFLLLFIFVLLVRTIVYSLG
ncbi:MAG: hypothetical protein SVR94_19150 [Pseudomonadota bacterium]|nr:hypothetical protein [Pseudomonadota bacterium]